MSEPTGRLETALEQVGAEHEPRPGWEARVLAAIDQKPCRRGFWLAGAVAAVLAIVVLIALPTRQLDGRVALHVTVTAVAPTMRGTGAHVGDRVHASATSGARYRSIWVYRNAHELVVVCPGGLSCASSRGATVADVTLQADGSYVFLAVASSSPLPAPHGLYDVDRVAAERAGAVTRSEHLVVR